MSGFSTSKKLRVGAATFAAAVAVGIGAFAAPGLAQQTISCYKTTVTADGGIEIETYVGTAPCPAGFTEADASTTTTEAAQTTTTEAVTTTTQAETTTTVAQSTTTAADAASTTTTVADDSADAPAAKAVAGDPDYTG